MRPSLGFVFVVFLLAISAQRVGAQGTIMKWTVDGEKREALVFAPTTDSAVKRPLVFAFHGHGGNMHGAAQLMHIHTTWPEAIVVYPQGLIDRPSPIDQQGNRPGWEVEANQLAGNVGNKDLDFFDAMLDRMRQKYLVDDDRVYATGFSNGGIFSYLLWAERSKVIAATGEVAGRLWDSEHLTQPRSILAIAGLVDTTDPYAMQAASIESARQADHATGDARAAYGGALTRAERTVTYDRTANTVTVRDLLASDTPRTWEWNLHSLNRMEPASGTRVSVRNGHARMCVEMQKSPGVQFTQSDEWTAPPSGKAEKQWHGRFATTQKTREAEFVAVMRIGKEC